MIYHCKDPYRLIHRKSALTTSIAQFRWNHDRNFLLARWDARQEERKDGSLDRRRQLRPRGSCGPSPVVLSRLRSFRLIDLRTLQVSIEEVQRRISQVCQHLRQLGLAELGDQLRTWEPSQPCIHRMGKIDRYPSKVNRHSEPVTFDKGELLQLRWASLVESMYFSLMAELASYKFPLFRIWKCCHYFL